MSFRVTLPTDLQFSNLRSAHNNLLRDLSRYPLALDFGMDVDTLLENIGSSLCFVARTLIGLAKIDGVSELGNVPKVVATNCRLLA